MSIGTATVVVGILIAGLLGVVAFALLRRPGQVRSTPLAPTGEALLDLGGSPREVCGWLQATASWALVGMSHTHSSVFAILPARA